MVDSGFKERSYQISSNFGFNFLSFGTGKIQKDELVLWAIQVYDEFWDFVFWGFGT